MGTHLFGSPWYVLCLGLPAAARGVNCHLLQVTVYAQLGPQLSLYFNLSILLVFSSLFCDFRSIFRWFRVLVVQQSTSGITIICLFFLSVPSDSPTVPIRPLSATFPSRLKNLVTPVKKKFIKNKFRICVTNNTFSITFYSLSQLWNEIDATFKKRKMPLLPPA